MVDTRYNQIYQVIQRDKAPMIVDRAERQGNSLVQPAHHIQKVCFDSRSIDQDRTDNNHLHCGFRRKLTKPLLSLHF
ncbi:hypothetical protein D9M71_747540 [compost metagenome]